MRVSIISHSYLAIENRKQLSMLSEKLQLELVSPSTMSEGMFSYRCEQDIRIGESSFMRFYKRINFPFLSSQYLLLSIDFNFRKFKPQVIHIEYDPWNFIFWQTVFLRRIFRKKTPLVCTVKQNTYTEYGPFITKIKDSVAKYFSGKVDRFIAVSKKTSSIYKERFDVNPKKFVHMTHLGVDTELFKPATREQKNNFRKIYKLPEGVFIIGYAGRFDDIRGADVLLEAVKKARRLSGVDLHLALIGEGFLKKDLLQESEKNSWLHVLPKVPHAKVADFLKTLDMFVMPSKVTKNHEEHDAHALLEAMSVGLPCIGTNSGVIPEILEDKNAGVIAKSGDEEKLSSEILNLFYDEKLRKKLGTLGRKVITDKYSIKSLASQLHQVYDEVYQQQFLP